MSITRVGLLGLALLSFSPLAWSQVIVPGTGTKVDKVGDDFEDEKWSYNFNLPKSSQENDGQQRGPTGASANGRWYEGALRGQPDVIKRVETPPGGLPGSTGSLLIRSRDSGVPGRHSNKAEQDDLIISVAPRLGSSIPISWSPNFVVRVWLPPFKEWEQRSGNEFGVRASCQTHKMEQVGRRTQNKQEPYWPGMFIFFNKGDDKTPDSATFIIRAGTQGNDFWGPKITETGWWTLGMSFSPDGKVHYFAHQGIDNLTAKDHITTQNPYGYRAEQFDTFFFNVVNADNGSWSTGWIIDDPTLYYTRR